MLKGDVGDFHWEAVGTAGGIGCPCDAIGIGSLVSRALAVSYIFL